jgi:hypothetical protein
MGIVITANPTRNVNGSSLLQSRWSAVNQPILFGATRQDHPVTMVQQTLGVFRIVLFSAPAGLVVGQKLWLKSGVNNQSVTIAAISGVQISLVETNLTAGTLGGFINLTTLRRNYYISINVYSVDESNTYVYAGTQDVRPAPSGEFTFDVHGYLMSKAEQTDNFAYNVINKKRIKTGSKYNFTIQEYWTGSNTQPSALGGANTYYWTNSAKQIQEKYNFNVGAHVLFRTIDTAKFMSDFDKPTYFPGFPFSLSFIWSEKVAGRQLQRVEDNFTATTTDNLDAAQATAVNIMMLKGGYATSVDEIDVWLNDGGVATLNYVSTGYVSITYVEPIPFEEAVKQPK